MSADAWNFGPVITDSTDCIAGMASSSLSESMFLRRVLPRFEVHLC